MSMVGDYIKSLSTYGLANQRFLGLKVGQSTLHSEPGIHTGVTIILPRGLENTTLHPCYAATHGLNAAGEMTGSHMIYEWGHLACVSVTTVPRIQWKLLSYI